MIYSSEKTPSELIPIFYADHQLGIDGGQSSLHVKMDIAKGIYFFVPNFDARRKAVPWHDIHHLITDYSAGTFIGECEISAWEVASGCKGYWAAFLIDTSGVLMGCFINPRKILHAYARGRRTYNLYHDLYPMEKVLDTPVSEIRKWLLLDTYPEETAPTFTDILSLGVFLIFAGIYSIMSVIFIPFLVIYNIWFHLRVKE